MAPAVPFSSLLLIVRSAGVTAALLVLIWLLHFRGGMSLISANKDLIFNELVEKDEILLEMRDKFTEGWLVVEDKLSCEQMRITRESSELYMQ